MGSTSELPHRLTDCAIALATGLGSIAVMSLLLTDGRTAVVLLFVAFCGNAFTWSDA